MSKDQDSDSFYLKERSKIKSSKKSDYSVGKDQSTEKEKLTDVLDNSDKEASDYSFLEIIKFAPKFYMESAPLIISRITSLILIITTMFCLKRSDDSSVTAGIGLSFSQYKTFYNVSIFSNSQVIIIQCGKLNGAKQYRDMKLTFLSALFLNYGVFLIASIAYCFADKMLIGLGIDESVANVSYQIAITTIPSLFIESYNEVLKSYLTSLKYQKPFFWLNTALCVLYPILGYIIMIRFEYGIYGYSIIKFIKEIIIFVTLQMYMKYCCKAQEKISFGYSFSEIKPFLTEHFVQFIKFWFQGFIAYLGWEASTIILGQQKDNNTQAAWASQQSITQIVFAEGQGCGQRAISVIANYIGQNRISEARKYAKLAWFSIFFLGICNSIILMIYVDPISRYYLKVPAAQLELRFMLTVMSFIIFAIMTLYINYQYVRLLGYNKLLNFYALFEASAFVVANAICFFVFNFPGRVIMYNFLIQIYANVAVMLLIIFYMGDWSKMVPQKEK